MDKMLTINLRVLRALRGNIKMLSFQINKVYLFMNAKIKLFLLFFIFSIILAPSAKTQDSGEKNIKTLTMKDINEKKPWTEEDVKAFLKLPYDKEFGKDMLNISLDKFHDFHGIKDFAMVSRIEQIRLPNSKISILNFSVASGILAVYHIYIYNPVSCQVASRSIQTSVTTGLPMLSKMPEIYLPQHNDNDVYALLAYTDPPQKWYLNIKHGIYIYVRYESSSKRLEKSPSNHDLLIKQMDQIISGLVSLLDGTYKVTDEQKTEYNKIRQKYKQAMVNEKQKKIMDIKTPLQ